MLKNKTLVFLHRKTRVFCWKAYAEPPDKDHASRPLKNVISRSASDEKS